MVKVTLAVHADERRIVICSIEVFEKPIALFELVLDFWTEQLPI